MKQPRVLGQRAGAAGVALLCLLMLVLAAPAAAQRLRRPGDTAQLYLQFEANYQPAVESYLTLDSLALALQKRKLRVELVGHTDEAGAPNQLLTQSTMRALAARQYLERRGVAAEQLRSRGAGNQEPLPTEPDAAADAEVPQTDTPDGPALARRGIYRISVVVVDE